MRKTVKQTVLLTLAVALGWGATSFKPFLAQPSGSELADLLVDVTWEDLLPDVDQDNSSTTVGEIAINPQLQGKQIVVSGYLLPLDVSGVMITEFLLVPYVGACITTPSPPPHQLIYVRPDRGIEIRSLFDPVRVTGHLDIELTNQDLSLLNVTETVDVNYSLKASQVELY